MIRKYTVLCILCLFLVTIASAGDSNISVGVYGNVTYENGALVPANSDIIAITQHGIEVGKFVTTIDGKYGSDMVFGGNKMLIETTYGNDIYFYINDIRADTMFPVTSSGNFQHDLIVPLPVTTPEPTIIVEPTLHPTMTVIAVQPTSILETEYEGIEMYVLYGIIMTFLIIIAGYLFLTYFVRDDNNVNTVRGEISNTGRISKIFYHFKLRDRKP